MNYKFRKRSNSIEAFQMTKERRWDNVNWPFWLHKAWNESTKDIGCFYCILGGDEVFINTIAGVKQVHFGDYIVKDVDGDIYPLTKEIFKKTYEEDKNS